MTRSACCSRGINPGLYSAATGWHFARPGNRFWPALHASGFTPRQLSPSEQAELTRYGLGITNIAPRATAQAAELTPAELREGAARLRALVDARRPASSPSPASPPTAPPSPAPRPSSAPSLNPWAPPASGSSRTPAASTPRGPCPASPRPSASCARPSGGLAPVSRSARRLASRAGRSRRRGIAPRIPSCTVSLVTEWHHCPVFRRPSNPVSLLAPYLYRQMLGGVGTGAAGPRWTGGKDGETPCGCGCPPRPGWPRAWAARLPWRSSRRRAQAEAAAAAQRRPRRGGGGPPVPARAGRAPRSSRPPPRRRARVLTDGSGRAVYLWAKDTGDTSACSGRARAPGRR